MSIKNLLKILIIQVLISTAGLFAQSNDDFLGHWIGSEDLSSPSTSYNYRNISILVNQGGEREGFNIYSSSSDFLYNQNLGWAYHYLTFNKESNQLIFLRRFMTPLGILGYEEIRYEIVDYLENSIVAVHESLSGDVFHQIRLNLNLLDIDKTLPDKFSLSQNYPNPFNPETTIEIFLKNKANGSLIIYNINGQKVRSLHSGSFSKGLTKLKWNGSNDSGNLLAGGFYVYSLVLDGSLVQTNRMLLLK